MYMSINMRVTTENACFFTFFINFIVYLANGDLEPAFARCCALGANWARRDQNCLAFPAPVPGEPEGYQSVCITAASVCCLRFYREAQCESGKQAAKEGLECTVTQQTGGEFYKDCCDGCKLGLISGSLATKCTFSGFSFGFPWNDAYLECCHDVSPQAATSKLPLPYKEKGSPFQDLTSDDRNFLFVNRPDSSATKIPDSENLCHQFPGQLCGHVCVPTPGSYVCQCRGGYHLSVDGKTCLQGQVKDRCEINNPCHQICHDTGVSVECSCNSGYQLASDGFTCNDIDECSLKIHKCSPEIQVCRNDLGTYSCINQDGSVATPLRLPESKKGVAGPSVEGIADSDRTRGYKELIRETDFSSRGTCPPGFKFNLQSLVCDDLDECSVAANICGPGESCQNTIGSYNCIPLIIGKCPKGFSFDLNHQSCLDIDECKKGSHTCRPSDICVNTRGSYKCKKIAGSKDCPPGYKYNADLGTCEDVDECSEGSHGCHEAEEKCRNIIGAFECEVRCQAGFQSTNNPPSCVDINECVAGNHNCTTSDHECVNTLGSFLCRPISRCPSGYKMNIETKHCEDINECSESASTCLLGQICVNTEGSFECQVECREGFKYEPSDPSICTDVDECLENPCGKNETCSNTEGSYMCKNVEEEKEKAEIRDTDSATPSTNTPIVAAVSEEVPCGKGFKLDDKSASCEDVDECEDKSHHCLESAEDCVNLPGTYTCKPKHCKRGFYRDLYTKECKDVNECLSDLCQSDEQCINAPGSFVCRLLPVCEDGLRRNNASRVCEDINECEEESHPCKANEICINTRGSFACRTSDCLPGFERNVFLDICQDIDECKTKEHNCHELAEMCVNSPGTYRCAPLPPCPNGFKRDQKSFRCVEDVDECEDGLDVCNGNETCINQYGKYKCQSTTHTCSQGFRYNTFFSNCQDIDECEEGIHSCVEETEVCVNSVGSFKCAARRVTCDLGFSFSENLLACTDMDECSEGTHLCSAREICVNLPGGYRCDRKDSITTFKPSTTSDVQNAVSPSPHCPDGYLYDPWFKSCRDIDECLTRPCKVNEVCVNTLRGYRCECEKGFEIDGNLGECKDINECQLEMYTCESFQRCDNTVGSYTCSRISGCGTGYTLNQNTGNCEDDDECNLKKDDCQQLGPRYVCVNTKGSFRCEKKECPPSQILNSRGICVFITCTPGFKPRDKHCVDINECLGGGHDCKKNEHCFNVVGSYECHQKLICGRGHKMDEYGTQCVDVDECTEGLDICSGGQVCINHPGGYTCQCQRGYRLDRNRQCQDIDECQTAYANICGTSAVCENTLGSFRCNCKQGFQKASDGKACTDIDECTDFEGICDHTCVNIWSSYYCTCNAGYKLQKDNRTCADINECDQGRGRLCLGTCVNTPGSFKCSCPDGYQLDIDQRTCKDINECDNVGICHGVEEICVNTFGDHRCQKIVCPKNYIRDSKHQNRCKREQFCPESDTACLQQPLTYSYNFLPLAANMTLSPLGQVDLFTMRGPDWSATNVQFDLILESANAPAGVTAATREFFSLSRTSYNQVMLTLIKPLEGPQEVMLNLHMKLYQNGNYDGGTYCRKVCQPLDEQCQSNATQAIIHHFVALPSVPELTDPLPLTALQIVSSGSWKPSYQVYFNILAGNDKLYFDIEKSSRSGWLRLVKPVTGPRQMRLELSLDVYDRHRSRQLRSRSLAWIEIDVAAPFY